MPQTLREPLVEWPFVSRWEDSSLHGEAAGGRGPAGAGEIGKVPAKRLRRSATEDHRKEGSCPLDCAPAAPPVPGTRARLIQPRPPCLQHRMAAWHGRLHPGEPGGDSGTVLCGAGGQGVTGAKAGDSNGAYCFLRSFSHAQSRFRKCGIHSQIAMGRGDCHLWERGMPRH